jgi:Zn-dependent protease with chaperone function
MADPDNPPSVPGPKRRKLRTFANMEASQLMHPWDTQATGALRRVPGLETLTKKVMEYGFERVYYLENIADNVRVTPKMFPRLHRSLQWGCKILGVPEPELYVNMDPTPKAFTYGHTRPFTIVTTGLLELLDEEEQLFVIGHELGHIKCGHVLYTVLAENLVHFVDLLSKATLGLGSLVGIGLALPLYDWYRKSKLSSDRAALLCVQDEDVAMRTLMKLAGGSRHMYAEMDRSEFMRQIRAYEEADESTLNKAYKFMITAFRQAPFPVMRAKHLDAWISDGGYHELTGIDLRAPNHNAQ